MTGTTIAHFKLIAKLGQGGMGEVYRATDTKLGRDVAIKVLPESLADDAERLARFQREAELLASLNHPNIAAIYGLEESGSSTALVLELVEGETLAERLQKGPLALEDTLEICLGIAEALESANEKGIIHRDLKPANVKFTTDGKVKVLDFGLAKALAPELERAHSPQLEDSPTITADYTMPGTILGTAAYMSPEQARGKPLDKRTDIWSFGCVLYECLAGKRLFQGEDVTETLASIIKGEPEWASLPANTPPTILLLLRKCLAKNRAKRLRDIGDACVDLEQAISDPSSSLIHLSHQALQSAGKNAGMPPMTKVAIILACGLFLALGWGLKPVPVPSPLPAAPVRNLNVRISEDAPFWMRRQALSISPDGRKLAFSLQPPDGSSPQLYLRHFDQSEATPLDGTANTSQF